MSIRHSCPQRIEMYGFRVAFRSVHPPLQSLIDWSLFPRVVAFYPFYSTQFDSIVFDSSHRREAVEQWWKCRVMSRLMRLLDSILSLKAARKMFIHTYILVAEQVMSSWVFAFNIRCMRLGYRIADRYSLRIYNLFKVGTYVDMVIQDPVGAMGCMRT